MNLLGDDKPYMEFVRFRLGSTAADTHLLTCELLEAPSFADTVDIHNDFIPEPVEIRLHRDSFLNKVVNIFIPLYNPEVTHTGTL